MRIYIKPTAKIGIRGPFGNMFPIEKAKGKDILFFAGGLGIVPLRPLIHKVMNEKSKFKRVALICGSRNPREILFKDDIDSWQKKGLKLILGFEKDYNFLSILLKKRIKVCKETSVLLQNT